MLVNKNLKKRDADTLKRFSEMQKATGILQQFFAKGFRSYLAITAIVQHYYPDLEVNLLFKYWHLRQIDSSVTDILEDVFEKLKSE